MTRLFLFIYIFQLRNFFYESSIADEKHFVLFIKDVFDKESSFIFNRWYADMAK